MDDVKDKVKGFMKKVNNPFTSSSSGKFKGQGRVLGSSSSTPPSNSVHNPRPIPTQNLDSKPTPSASNPKPLPQKTINSEHNGTTERDGKLYSDRKPDSDRKPGNGFDPFDSLVTSSKRSQNGYTVNVYECPICGRSFRSQEEVSEHVDNCLSNRDDDGSGVSELAENGVESSSELEICVGTYI